MAFTRVDYWLIRGGWNQGTITRSGERLDWDSMRSNQRLELNGKVGSFFNEVDTVKELSSLELVSFFKELNRRKETMLQ